MGWEVAVRGASLEAAVCTDVEVHAGQGPLSEVEVTQVSDQMEVSTARTSP